jgi:two-component system, chemotaxis family, chemotaxis protein CheY
MTASIPKPDLAHLRVQIVGSKGHAGAMLRIVLAAAGVGHVVQIEDSRRALALLSSEHFDAVFVEESHLDSLNFARSARKRAALRNPLIPIFAVYNGPRRKDVERARDLGVTNVICRPVSPKTVSDKLLSALVKPRPFIAAPEFFGPDRRARSRVWRGQDRRKTTPRKSKIIVDV